MQKVLNYTIKWENIDISIAYKPDYFKSANVSHLEVKAKEPLPFTDSGYRSIWLMKGELDGLTGVEQYVINALNYDSNTNKWKDHLKQKANEILEKQQLSLF